MRRLFFCCFFTFSVTSQALDLSIEGQKVKSLSLEEIRLLQKPESVSIADSHEPNKPIPYLGFANPFFLTQLFGESWLRYSFVQFICADGYRVEVPRLSFVMFRSWIVFAREDQTAFSFRDHFQKEKTQELGPFYLVWDTLREPMLHQYSTVNWPYQIVSINLISTQETFSELLPEAKAVPEVKDGYSHFRNHCFACHSPSAKGPIPDVNQLVQKAMQMGSKTFEQFVRNPTSVKVGSQMPMLGILKAEELQHIYQYLRYLSQIPLKAKP